jgi:hypothetical protein
MTSKVFINKETGKRATQISIMELAKWREATPEEQADYYNNSIKTAWEREMNKPITLDNPLNS